MSRIVTGILLLAGAASAQTSSSKVMVGKPAPDFTITTMDGKRIRPRDLHGKRALLFMWASW